MTDQPRKRITIDAPDSPTILAARHLDATEGRVQVGSTVDSAARAAITRVLDYVAKAHNSPATADLPASTAPAAAAHPIVRGRCPACRGESLFLGSGGHVTCSRLDCPDPTAADDQLHHTDPTESRPRLVAPGVSNPQTGTGLASGTNWTTAGPGRSAGQNLAFTSAPAEHCGHLKPDFLGGTPTECVLRPGHSGSHADHNGTRWWKTTEQALEDQDTAPAATEATDTPAVPATRARYAQAVARVESSGPRPANPAFPSGPPCIPDHGAAVYCPGCAHDATELTAEEARDLADELGLQLYRAQDALAFVAECCDIADRNQQSITTADVREWLKGAQCGRQLAASNPGFVLDPNAPPLEFVTWSGPHFTYRPVTPEMERAATERARQAAAASERGRLEIANRALNTAALEAVERAERAEAKLERLRAVRDRWLLMTLEPGQVRRLLDDLTAALDTPTEA